MVFMLEMMPMIQIPMFNDISSSIDARLILGLGKWGNQSELHLDGVTLLTKDQ